MSDLVSVKVSVTTGYVGCRAETEVEIDREIWESMSEFDKNEYLLEDMFGLIEWNWEEMVDDTRIRS